MNQPNINQVFEGLAQELTEERIRRQSLENQRAEQSAFAQNKDAGTIVLQIDPSDDLDKLYHLLKGDIFIDDQWKPNPDSNQRIFTELGIQEIMNKLHPYLSKQITLGNYTEEEIQEKMMTFSTLFTYFVLNRSEDFFHYPRPYELYENMVKLIEVNKEFSDIDQEELYKKCEVWSKNELDKRINHFKITINAIVDLVHAAYNRALKGATHKGITRNYHVSENNPLGEKYGDVGIPQKRGILKWKKD